MPVFDSSTFLPTKTFRGQVVSFTILGKMRERLPKELGAAIPIKLTGTEETSS
jgi:hypothetical protein